MYSLKKKPNLTNTFSSLIRALPKISNSLNTNKLLLKNILKFLCKAYQSGVLGTIGEEEEFTRIAISITCNWLQTIKEATITSADLSGIRWCIEIIYEMVEKSLIKWTSKAYEERTKLLKQLLYLVNICMHYLFG